MDRSGPHRTLLAIGAARGRKPSLSFPDYPPWETADSCHPAAFPQRDACPGGPRRGRDRVSPRPRTTSHVAHAAGVWKSFDRTVNRSKQRNLKMFGPQNGCFDAEPKSCSSAISLPAERVIRGAPSWEHHHCPCPVLLEEEARFSNSLRQPRG